MIFRVCNNRQWAITWTSIDQYVVKTYDITSPSKLTPVAPFTNMV